MKLSLIAVLSLFAVNANAGSITLNAGQSITIDNTTVSCQGGYSNQLAIRVISAQYHNINASARVASMCNGQSYCSVTPTAMYADPSYGYPKIFQVQYVCVANGTQVGPLRTETQNPVIGGVASYLNCY